MIVCWYFLRRLLAALWIVIFLTGITVHYLSKYNDELDQDIHLNFKNRLHRLQDDLKKVYFFSFYLVQKNCLPYFYFFLHNSKGPSPAFETYRSC